MSDCRKCIHKPVCDLWYEQECQNASCCFLDGCELYDNGGWISVDDRMPDAPFGCLLIVWDSPCSPGGDDFLNYLPYFAGWDGEQWNDGDGEKVPFEVVYWMPLPTIPPEADHADGSV